MTAREVGADALLVVMTPASVGVMTTEPNAGEQLDAIMRDLDRTGAAWEKAGYGYDTPEYAAREAVFARLKAWNDRNAAS